MIAKSSNNMAKSSKNHPILYKPDSNSSKFSFFFKLFHLCKYLQISKL